MTGSTTPTFATADPELAVALEERLDGIELKSKGGVDYVLRHKLVQRIVAAYDEHSQRAAPELRPAQQQPRRRTQ